MWPQALQMTRDECRGILRRLELETYSQVISVFRAQGGLSDSKAKMLEELRGTFHISQERHRAESRRVANDEELATIAEAISGPNTWQEWAREGRRCFPMLPRVPPQTALALLANSVACETAAENAKLAYPAHTGIAVAEEQAELAAARNEIASTAVWDAECGAYVVTSDPFKMPDIPAAGIKKNLKRNISDNSTGSSKKRNVGGESASPTKHQQQQLQQKQYHHITANTNASPQITPSNSNIRKLYHNHNKLQEQQQQQRQYQQQQKQQQQTKQRATKRNANAGEGAAKRQATPAKSGRRAQKQQEQQQQKQLLQQQQQQLQHQQQLQLAEQHAQQQQQQAAVARNLTYIGNPGTPPTNLIAHFDDELHDYATSLIAMPQIAASKRDITKNLTKLQIPATVTPLGDAMTSPNAGVTPPPPPPQLHGKATPVQKYIVEDRQPQQQQQSPQIMTLPQLSAATTKLRAQNTTILPPGTKLTATTGKKLVAACAEVIASGSAGGGAVVGSYNQPQVFSLIDGGGGTTITTNAPGHTPPAVIQLHGGGGESPQPAQSKVLTTKLLPVVLSGSSAAAVAAGGANIAKIETLNNGATLMTAGGGVGGQSATSSAAISGTIIKNLPPTMLLSAAGGGSVISTLGAGATVFRKPPNIIKTAGILGMGTTTSKLSSTSFNAVNTSHGVSGSSGGGNAGGAQIISNIKLAPAMTTTTLAVTTQQQQQYLQQQLKNVTTTGIRTSVKICQSPNGKMFIQPANLDAASKAKFAVGGALQHKLLAANTLIGSGGGLGTTLVGSGGGVVGGSGSSAPSTPQRIAIQKVQIIPAPLANSPTGGAATVATLQKPTTLTLSSVNKSNMIFVPASSATRVGATPGTITLSKSAILQAKSPQAASATDGNKPPNVVIIGAAHVMPPQKSPQQSVAVTKLASATFIDGTNSSSCSGNKKISEMITEDTPVDILSMPIIVDDGGDVIVAAAAAGGGGGNTTTIVGNNIGDTVTVLASNIIETATTTTTTKHQAPTVILDATDWEMELDQATAKARSSGSTQRRSNASSVGRKRKSSSGDAAFMLDDNFDDVIVVEQDDIEAEEGDDMVLEKQTCEMVVEDGGQVTTDNIIILGDGAESIVTTAEDDEPPIQVIDDDQRDATNTAKTTTTVLEPAAMYRMQQETNECETDAGFDETIDAEIDENTAIEYIEEEHSAGTHHEDNSAKSVVEDDGTKRAAAADYSGEEEQNDRPTSTFGHAAATSDEEDKVNTINCRFSEIISSSGDESDPNAFVFAQELEAETLTHTVASNSSQDEQ